MAITFDASKYFTGNTNPVTTTFTCGNNAKLLVLDIGFEGVAGGGGRQGGVPSYGGQLFYNVNVSSGTLGECKVEMFAIENPSTGSAYTVSIPNVSVGNILNSHLSSYNASSGYNITLDTSINRTLPTFTSNNASLNISPSVVGELIVATNGNGSNNATIAAFPGDRITPFLDKGNCQNESQWYITTSTNDISLGFSFAGSISGNIVGLWKEVLGGTKWGGILKFYNTDNTWKECPSSHFKIYTGSSWTIVPPEHFKIYRDDFSPAGWYPIRFDGSMGVAVETQNYLVYSEQLDNAAWTGDLTVSTNTGVDLEGNTTLDTLTASGAYQTKGQDYITVTASTQYTWSFDAIRGTQGTAFYFEIYDNTHDTTIDTIDFYSSTSGSVQRVSINFTTPAGCTSITPFFMWAASGDNMKIGRVQLALPGKGYVETTSSPVP